MSMLLNGEAFVSRCSVTPKSLFFLPAGGHSETALGSVADQKRREVLEFCEDLRIVVEDAAVDGWDGPHSKAYDTKGLRSLHLFINAMPVDFPLPIMSIDFKGRLILEWKSSSDASFACMLGEAGRVSYSWFFLGQQSYGSFDFSGDQLPMELALAASQWWRESRYNA